MRSAPARAFPQFFATVGFAVLCLLAAMVLLELFSWAAWSTYHWVHPDPYPSLAASPAYAGEAWATEYWEEHTLRLKSRRGYVPFRVWGLTEWHGKYINTDQSEMGIWRRTLNPTSNTCDQARRRNIWVFGGSTVFGTGAPDWETLPSYLSRDLNDAGTGCVVVSNFGVEGYVVMQELILLIEQLKAGRHPDVVIFYDGFNDATLARNAPAPSSSHFEFDTIKARIEGSVFGRFDFMERSYSMRVAHALLGYFRGDRSQPPVTESYTRVAAPLDAFEANLQVANALGQAYHFKFYDFWQPALLYGKKPLVPFEEQIARLDADAAADRIHSRTIAAVYREAQDRAQKDHSFIYLGGLFDSTQQAIYIDEVHTGPLGNELAAKAVARYVTGSPNR